MAPLYVQFAPANDGSSDEFRLIVGRAPGGALSRDRASRNQFENSCRSLSSCACYSPRPCLSASRIASSLTPVGALGELNVRHVEVGARQPAGRNDSSGRNGAGHTIGPISACVPETPLDFDQMSPKTRSRLLATEFIGTGGATPARRWLGATPRGKGPCLSLPPVPPPDSEGIALFHHAAAP